MIKIFENPDFFKRFKPCKKIIVMEQDIDNLKVIVYKNEKKEKNYLNIEKSPAYNFLLGNKEVYFKYLNLEDDDHRHTENDYIELIKSVRLSGIKKYIIINEKKQIIDGQHRAAIMKFYYKKVILPVLMAIF